MCCCLPTELLIRKDILFFNEFVPGSYLTAKITPVGGFAYPVKRGLQPGERKKITLPLSSPSLMLL